MPAVAWKLLNRVSRSNQGDHLRNIFIAFSIFALPNAHADTCVELYASNQSMLIAALQSQVLPTEPKLISLDIDRQSSVRGVIIAGYANAKGPMTLTVAQKCDGSLTVAKGDQGFVCTKKLNCMPPLTPQLSMYCTEEYLSWADTHCGHRPDVSY